MEFLVFRRVGRDRLYVNNAVLLNRKHVSVAEVFCVKVALFVGTNGRRFGMTMEVVVRLTALNRGGRSFTMSLKALDSP